jgi:hypothetical protein
MRLLVLFQGPILKRVFWRYLHAKQRIIIMMIITEKQVILSHCLPQGTLPHLSSPSYPV